MTFSIKSLYLTYRFFIFLSVLIGGYVLSYLLPFIIILAHLLSILFLLLVIYELISIYSVRNALEGSRLTSDRFSNGDHNTVTLHLTNHYPFRVFLEVYDEVPFPFQFRDANWRSVISPGKTEFIHYLLRPVKRGDYEFGNTQAYASTFLRMLQRRFSLSKPVVVPVYPSYIQMRKHAFSALSDHLVMSGAKKIRKPGHTHEFDTIKEYVVGDDTRTINWKATARRNVIMVNQFQDQKAQNIYCIIDKGRLMKFPFDGMSLLDYAINASLALSYIAIKKEDKAGMISFSDTMSTVLPADKARNQMEKMMIALYNQKTRYPESNFEILSKYIHAKIHQRSLLLLFTNFESIASFRRQIPYMVSLAGKHVLVVVFFENSELNEVLAEGKTDMRSVYTRVIARQSVLDKYLICKELSKYGIYSVLTLPQNLSVNTINMYLDIKRKGVI